MTEPLAPEAILLHATQTAKSLHRKVRIIKLGGSALEDPDATLSMLQSVVALQTLGLRLVLVHGGGMAIDRSLEAAGIETKRVAGRRITDETALEIVVRVLRDQVNASIVAQIEQLGGHAVGPLNGLAPILHGDILTLSDDNGVSVDLGRVGTVSRVDVSALHNVLDSGRIPVIPCIGQHDDGGWLNINADTAAGAVAGALDADLAVFLTNTPGVLRSRDNPLSLIPELTRADCLQLIKEGIIAGGMIPKVEACLEALDAGVERTQILDGRQPLVLLQELTPGPRSGTQIRR